jgi:hypothetical protein
MPHSINRYPTAGRGSSGSSFLLAYAPRLASPANPDLAASLDRLVVELNPAERVA